MDEHRTPLISVIIPVYNVEQYLDQCIQSVLGQSYKNLQIILIDDGSPDQSGAICDQYSERDGRITVVHQKNRGLSAARNTGLDIAKGEYIAFLDSDDWIYPQAYEYLYQTAVKYQADIVQISAESNVSHPVRTEEQIQIFDEEDLLELAISGKWNWTVWSNLYQKEIWQALRFEEGYIYEDTLVLPELAKLVHRCVKSNKTVYYYRRRDTGILRRPKDRQHLDAQKRIYEKFLKIGRENPQKMPMIAYYICANMASYRMILKWSEKNLSFSDVFAHKQYLRKMDRQLFGLARKSDMYQKSPRLKKLLWGCYWFSPAPASFVLTIYKVIRERIKV